MKRPRNLSAADLIQALATYGYRVTRQRGWHIRLTTQQRGEHHVTIHCGSERLPASCETWPTTSESRGTNSPGDRQQSMTEVIADLEECLAEQLTGSAGWTPTAVAAATDATSRSDDPFGSATSPSNSLGSRQSKKSGSKPSGKIGRIENKKRWFAGVVIATAAMLTVAAFVALTGRLNQSKEDRPDDALAKTSIRTAGMNADQVATTKVSTTPRLPASSIDAPIDLLALIDPVRDATTGEWKFDSGALITPPIRRALLEIPYAPPEEYELTAVLEKVRGEDGLHVGLVVGGSQTIMAFDVGEGGRYTGVERVDDVSFHKNATARQHAGNLLAAGRQHTIVCTIRNAGAALKQLVVTLNDEPIVDWAGAPSRLSTGGFFPVRRTDRFFLGDWETSFRIGRLEIRPLDAGPAAAPGETAGRKG